MRVEVRLFATLGRFFPDDHDGDAACLDVPEGTTLADLTRYLGIPGDMPRVALVNGRDAGPEHPLAHDDVVALFPPLSGGAA